ncbi:MAG: class I SAM-dependent methyltransferase [Elainellaceae cyanobacterium]
MATILRSWSYRYQWLYDAVSWVSALAVGGVSRFHRLPIEGLTLDRDAAVLDLCCGSGQATAHLTAQYANVTGLDASPKSIKRAQRNVPTAQYVEAWAEAMPFEDQRFDLVHTSVALHEMTAEQLGKILSEVHRVLKPGGIFACIDLHQPTNPVLVPGLYAFMLLFETETAWRLIRADLAATVAQSGFEIQRHAFHGGGSLQVIQAVKLPR